jgi:hypothetical protein
MDLAPGECVRHVGYIQTAAAGHAKRCVSSGYPVMTAVNYGWFAMMGNADRPNAADLREAPE